MMPTKLAKEIAHHVSSAFGGDKARVWEHRDATEKHSIDVLSCAETPGTGLTSYSTVTLHQSPVRLGEVQVITELAGVAGTDHEAFGDVIGTAALWVINDDWPAQPGAILSDVVGDFGLSDRLVHLLFVPPFPWEAELTSFQTSTGATVHWLLGVPISESERRFAQREGFDALEGVLAQHEIAYYDLERQPVA